MDTSACMATNVLNVAAGASLAVVRTAFEKFGEVASVSPLPADPSFVEVIFFDVRAAARAIEAVGSWSCQPAAQVGTFAVKMPGNTAFKVEDFSGVSGVRQDPDDDNSFILEFFDMRDAVRYQERMEDPEPEVLEPPPGLAPPPGLEDSEKPPGLEVSDTSSSQCVSPPPGLSGDCSSQDSVSTSAAAPAQVGAYQVQITGLPNDILSEAMFEAVLQQAGLDGCVVSFTTSKGKQWGTATVKVGDILTAEWCAKHFRGRRWNSAGTEVVARISAVGGGSTKAAAAAAAAAVCGLSAQAAAFQPMPVGKICTKASSAAPASGPGTLSAEAPTFVPGAPLAERTSPAARKHRQGGMAASDTSTEVGDSEAEDEKDEARAQAAQR